MKLFKFVDLQNWEEIKRAVPIPQIDMSKVSYNPVSVELREKVMALLRDDLNRIYGHDPILRSMFLLTCPPEAEKVIHMDLCALEGVEESLNIPIQNYDQTAMRWFEGQFELKRIDRDTPAGQISYLDLIWEEEPKLLHEERISSPAVVRLNIPHQVISTHPDVRVLLVVRFHHDHKTLH